MPPDSFSVQYYPADKTRISTLASVAPQLTGPGYRPPPQRAYRVAIDNSNELMQLFNWYSEKSSPPATEVNMEDPIKHAIVTKVNPIMSLNQILYGPPGTGKTFTTARLAVEICDGTAPEAREALMARYEVLRKEERIRFVTFHQSYGYEDFVEGLRPESRDGQVSYRVRPGIFREACNAARLSSFVPAGLDGPPLHERTIFKMSLGEAGAAEGRQALQACLEHGYVVLGWGNNVDFTECGNLQQIQEKIDQDLPHGDRNGSHVRYVNVFKEQLKADDIVIISQGNRAFRAIGVVTGDYEFSEAAIAGAFHQIRPVRWLAVMEGNRDVAEIYHRNFMNQSLYMLDANAIDFPALEALILAAPLERTLNHVLIIDEINRANIAKVFGELITLLEPDKREGAANALTVKLPYSGEDFSVPDNLHVLGTMNTADRSIALLDTALRRRFDFEELQPDPLILAGVQIDGINLDMLLTVLNERIAVLYDRDHTIGHAFFLGIATLAELDLVFRRKVLPLLQEYFYENLSNVRRILNDLGEGDFVRRQQGAALPADGEDTYDEAPRTVFSINPLAFPVEAYQRIYAGR